MKKISPKQNKKEQLAKQKGKEFYKNALANSIPEFPTIQAKKQCNTLRTRKEREACKNGIEEEFRTHTSRILTKEELAQIKKQDEEYLQR